MVSSGNVASRIDIAHLSLSIPQKGGEKSLLEDITCTFPAGKLVVIAGPSGCGKSLLLSSLRGDFSGQGRVHRAIAYGRLQIMGVTVTTEDMLYQFVDKIGYMAQEPVLQDRDTVEETLISAAQIKLPEDTPKNEIMDAVESVLTEVRLEAFRHHAVRLLSGGQRQRTSFAMELLSRPQIMLLDEPTSAQDPDTAFKLLLCLRHYIDNGGTVICTSHSEELIRQGDLVLLLGKGGAPAFYGSPLRMFEHFPGESWRDIYVRLDRGNYSRWQGRIAPGIEKTLNDVAEPQIPSPKKQFNALIRRDVRLLLRDVPQILLHVVMPFVLALMVSQIFDSNICSPKSLPSESTLLFLLSMVPLLSGVLGGVTALTGNRAQFEREASGGLSCAAYGMSKIGFKAYLGLASTIIFLCPVLGIINLRLQGNAEIIMLCLMVLCLLVSTLMGLLISALSQSGEQAAFSGVWLIFFQIVFSGLVPLDNLPSAWRFLGNLSICRWCWGGLCDAAQLQAHLQNHHLQRLTTDVMRTDATMAIVVISAFGAVLLKVLVSLLCRSSHRIPNNETLTSLYVFRFVGVFVLLTLLAGVVLERVHTRQVVATSQKGHHAVNIRRHPKRPSATVRRKSHARNTFVAPTPALPGSARRPSPLGSPSRPP